MTEAFRADGKLPELIVLLEAEKGQDFQRLATMGALSEETGAVDNARAIGEEAQCMGRVCCNADAKRSEGSRSRGFNECGAARRGVRRVDEDERPVVAVREHGEPRRA